jgi:YfiH family protein
MGWRVARWSSVPGLEQCFGDRREIPDRAVITLRQVHGREVHAAGDVVGGETSGDGLVACPPSSFVGVWTADCVPVHLLASDERVAAALHCGWRGTAAGIVPAAIALLEKRWSIPATRIEAALGPAIGGCCYVVGEEVRGRFVERAGEKLGAVGFRTRARELYLDLRKFLAAELTGLGVSRIYSVGPCTACRTDVLHSYRAAPGSGRQLSWIGWLG